MPKASIIIPIYNVKNYMKKCVDSVINQTEKDIEIILVDDGSTDGSELLCDEFSRKDSRITVIHKKNGGLSSARNAGVQIAKSDYILFVDGDDYILRNTVQRLVEIVTLYPADVVQFEYIEVEENDKTSIDEKKENIQINRADTSRALFDNLYRKGGVYASGCTKLICKKLLQRIPFASLQHEDEMWCTMAFSLPISITYTNETFYCYVMRPNSIIHSSFNHKSLDIYKVIYRRIETLKELSLEHLLPFEYSRLFSTIVKQYTQARACNDKEAMNFIHGQFSENKTDIGKFAKLNKKYSILFRLMKINFSFIIIYCIYRSKNETD